MLAHSEQYSNSKINNNKKRTTEVYISEDNICWEKIAINSAITASFTLLEKIFHIFTNNSWAHN
jgi:hypothetical protein